MATARSACFASEEAKARAICVFTSTGRSALYVSKQRPDVKIIAMTASERTCRRMEICFGVTPFKLSGWSSVGEMTAKGVDALKRKGIVKKSDKIVVVCGTTTTPGATNMIRILSA
jgi:pyruvate kinase